jgi:hypothetical protein
MNRAVAEAVVRRLGYILPKALSPSLDQGEEEGSLPYMFGVLCCALCVLCVVVCCVRRVLCAVC